MGPTSASFRLTAGFVALLFLGASPAKADTYNFDFTSAFGYSVVGSFTTGNADGPGYDITSISGTIISANPSASSSIQGLVPGNATAPTYLTSGDGSYFYDNIFLPAAPYFTTTAGLLFKSNAGFEYNIYTGGGCCGSLAGVTYLSTNDGGASFGFYPGVPGLLTASDPPTLTLSTVPLPATLPLFATGLGALGLLGWRRKRQHAALAA
jgi:hypothetical protein